jgi:hypothetical protein
MSALVAASTTSPNSAAISRDRSAEIRSVEDQGGLGAGRDPLERRAQQGRLAGPHLAREQDESLAPRDAVAKRRQALLVCFGEPQEARIGSQREGQLPEAEERLVHFSICSANQAGR